LINFWYLKSNSPQSSRRPQSFYPQSCGPNIFFQFKHLSGAASRLIAFLSALGDLRGEQKGLGFTAESQRAQIPTFKEMHQED
jgi:hypothetical protein